MGYQFYNNWPYSNSVFPTMEDHVDPVNHVYFSGLMTELENIENELGLDPAGTYDTIKDRLNADDVSSKKNLLENGNFEIWQRGTTLRPDRWIVAYQTEIAQESTIVQNGRFSLKVKEDTNSNYPRINQYLEFPSTYANKTLTFSIWIYNPSPNGEVKCCIGDDAGETTTDWISTKNQWFRLTITRTITAAPTFVKGFVRSQNTDGEYMYYDFATMVESPISIDIAVPYSEDIQKCLRWYWKTTHFVLRLYGTAADLVGYWISFPTSMAGIPTVTLSGGGYTNASTLTSNAGDTDKNGFPIRITVTAPGSGVWYCNAGTPGYIQAEFSDDAP